MTLSIYEWVILGGLLLTNALTAFVFYRHRRYWDSLPVLSATIEHSKIHQWNDTEGRSHYDAQIRFSYRYNEQELQSETPALRGIEMLTPRKYNYELVQRYKVGDTVIARVVPTEPFPAYLEKAPAQWVSMAFLPAATIVYAAVALL